MATVDLTVWNDELLESMESLVRHRLFSDWFDRRPVVERENACRYHREILDEIARREVAVNIPLW